MADLPKRVVLTGKVKWAQVHKPNQYGKFSLNLVLDDEESKKTVKSLGTNTRIDKDGDLVVTVARNAMLGSTGKQNTPPTVVDAKKQKFTGDIGNGSTVKLVAKPWHYTRNGGGVSLDLVAVQVLDLVKFVPKNTALEILEEEDGFVASNADTVENEDLDGLDTVDF